MSTMTVEQWRGVHNDTLHPSTRQECEHCQEMIRVFGPMPSADELAEQGSSGRRSQYVKATIPERLRWQVFERDNFTCQKCGTHQRLTVDHIHPEVLGGDLNIDNLQTLCRPCNSKKGAKVS